LVLGDPVAGVVEAGVPDESEPDPEDSDDPPSVVDTGAVASPATEVVLPERLSVL
jgi:hypothetical protein